MKPFSYLPLGLGLLALAVSTAARADQDKYVLRYHFQPGEILRWEVTHRTTTRTTVSSTTQTAETFSKSVKAWRVKETNPDGSATFEHVVENVDMRHTLTGRATVRYNSQTDEQPPQGFQHVAESVGVPLSLITMDAQGKILLRRQQKTKPAGETKGRMTIPLPAEPVAVGHSWSHPEEIQVTLNSGGIKRIKAVQQFTLLSVKTGVATIRLATQILTPIEDPALESQVMQHRSKGTVRFDVEAGRILSQQMDVDEHCVGFRGQASSLHFATRFNEKLLPSPTRTAQRPADRNQR